MSQYIQHVGVKGMRWGIRKSVKDYGREVGTLLKNQVLHPRLTDRANTDSVRSEKSTATKFRRGMLFSKTKEIADVNARVEKMKRESKKAPSAQATKKAHSFVDKNAKKPLTFGEVTKIQAQTVIAIYALIKVSQFMVNRLQK